CSREVDQREPELGRRRARPLKRPRFEQRVDAVAPATSPDRGEDEVAGHETARSAAVGIAVSSYARDERATAAVVEESLNGVGKERDAGRPASEPALVREP